MAVQIEFAVSQSGAQVEGNPSWGFHGSGDYLHNVAVASGLPDDRGADRRLAEHVCGNPDSAFRGTVGMPAGDGAVLTTAAQWAGLGGLVFEITEVPGWDTTLHATKAVQLQGRREAETAILRRVPAQAIKRIGIVIQKSRGGRPFLGVNWNPVP